QEPVARTTLLREAGLLYEEKLRSAPQAFDRYVEAFLLSPHSAVLREDVERVAAKVNGWERVFATYAQAIEQATDPENTRALRLYYGKALQSAGRTEAAIEQFRAVHADRGDDVEAIAALEA